MGYNLTDLLRTIWEVRFYKLRKIRTPKQHFIYFVLNQILAIKVYTEI